MEKSSGAIVALALVFAIILSSGTVYAGWSNYDNFNCCSWNTGRWSLVAWHQGTVVNPAQQSPTKYYCENNWGYVYTYASWGGMGILYLNKDSNSACANDLKITASAKQDIKFTKLKINSKWWYTTYCQGGCGHASHLGLIINGVEYGWIFSDGLMWKNPGWTFCSAIHSGDDFDYYFTWDGTTLRGWAQNLKHPAESCGTESNPIVFGNVQQPGMNNFYATNMIGGGYAQKTTRYVALNSIKYYTISSPSVSVTNPGNIEVVYPTPSAQITISTSITSEAASVSCGRYKDGSKIDTVTVNTAGGTASNSYTGTFNVGSHTFELRCTDFMGQSRSNTATFSVISVDRVAPTVSMRSYLASVRTLPMTARILASDDRTQSLSCRFSEPTGKINPGTFTCQNGVECSFSVGTGAALPEGTYRIDITCQDATPNSGSTSFSFKFDSLAPSIALGSPANNILINVNDINFTFTPDDSGPMNCSFDVLKVGGSAVSRNIILDVRPGIQRTVKLSLPLTSGSTYSWNINCTDEVGNVGTSETRTFRYVTSPDSINLMDPVDGNSTSSSSQEFTFSHNFTRMLWFITLLPTCSLNINSVQVATLKDVPAGTQQSFSYEDLQEGTTSWFINCSIDLWPLVSAQVSSETRSLIVDMSAPTLDLVSPNDNDIISLPYPITTRDVQFKYNISDTQATNFTCSLLLSTPSGTTPNTVDTETVASGMNTFNKTLGAGTYYWKINCSDGFFTTFAPASGSRKLVLKIIDVTAPIITLVYPDNNTVIHSDFGFKFKVTDDMSSTIACNLILNDRPDNGGSYINGSTNPISPSSISGETRWKINCTDTTGNSRESEERIVTVDRPPIITSFTPVTETYINRTEVKFIFTVIDDLDTTLTCNISIDGTAQLPVTAISGQERQVTYTLSQGKHTSKLQCWDSRSGATEDPIIYVDITSPLLTASKPDNNFTTCNMRTSFTFSVSDDLSKNVTCNLMLGTSTIWSVVIDLPAAAWAPVEKTIIPTQDLPLGQNEWYVRCTDLAGNINTSAKRNITIATTDPDNFRINFIPPTLSNGWYTITDSLVINVTADKDLSTAWLELNEATYTMDGANKNWYISKTGLQNGANVYRVYGKGAVSECLAYSERTIMYRPDFATPERRPFILTLAEFQEPAIWTAVVIAIAALMLGIAYMLSKLFALPEWEAFAKDEFGQLIFSAFLFIMFVLISGIIEEGSDGLANDILMKTAAAGENVTYWSYNSQAGNWSTSNIYKCEYPCHVYLARGFLGTTYESYKNTFKEVSRAYVVSKLYESVALGSTADIVPATWKLDIAFSVPMFAGRAIYDNSLEVVIKDLARAMSIIKAQEIALAYAVNLAFTFFIGGIVLRVPWFTRKFGGLLIALAIGLYVFLPFIYILGWYTIDKTGIVFDFQDSEMVSEAGQLGDTFLGETDISALFTSYDTDGRETKMGLLDVTGRAYIAAIFMPALAILTVIGFVRQFSPMIGGDTEIAGLSRLI